MKQKKNSQTVVLVFFLGVLNEISPRCASRDAISFILPGVLNEIFDEFWRPVMPEYPPPPLPSRLSKGEGVIQASSIAEISRKSRLRKGSAY